MKRLIFTVMDTGDHFHMFKDHRAYWKPKHRVIWFSEILKARYFIPAYKNIFSKRQILGVNHEN